MSAPDRARVKAAGALLENFRAEVGFLLIGTEYLAGLLARGDVDGAPPLDHEAVADLVSFISAEAHRRILLFDEKLARVLDGEDLSAGGAP